MESFRKLPRYLRLYFQFLPLSAFSYLLSCVLVGSILVVVRSAEAQRSAPEVLTLEDCYQRAVANSESLLQQQAQVRFAEAQYRLALSAVYPAVSFGATQRYRNSAEYGVIGGLTQSGEPLSQGTRRTIGRSQTEAFLTVSQPLFTGFREWLTAKALTQQATALSYDLQRSRDLLMNAVAELYYQVVQDQKDKLVVNESGRVLQDRLKELNQYLSLGKAKESELLGAQAEYELLRTTEQMIEGRIAATRELLAYLVNQPSHSFTIKDDLSPRFPLEDVDSLLVHAMERPDLKAASLRVQAQGNLVTVNQRENWPTLGLTGSSFVWEDPERNRDWEAAFSLSMPLFDGGRRDALVEQAQAERYRFELRGLEVRRQVERDVRSISQEYASILLEKKLSSSYVDAAQKAYQAQKNDYDLGVVTNLDVLQALRQLLEAKRKVIEIAGRAALSSVQLSVAANLVPKTLTNTITNHTATMTGAP